MQSLSNVIKKTNVIDLGNKEVITLCINKIIEEKLQPEIVPEENTSVLDNAMMEAEKIIENSRKEAEKAYNEAYENGYREGFKKGAQDVTAEAEKRNKAAMDKIEQLYSKAVSEYNNYLRKKENEIKLLISNTVKNILKREMEFSDSLNEIIVDALNQEQGSKVIIRCSEKYCTSLRNRIDIWKRETGNNIDVFVIEDVTMKDNSAVLIKDEGRAVLDLNDAIDNIEKVILGEA